MKKRDKDYIVIYQPETDGDVLAALMNKEKIIKLVKHLGSQEEIMIIGGIIIKSFGNKIDLTEL